VDGNDVGHGGRAMGGAATERLGAAEMGGPVAGLSHGALSTIQRAAGGYKGNGDMNVKDQEIVNCADRMCRCAVCSQKSFVMPLSSGGESWRQSASPSLNWRSIDGIDSLPTRTAMARSCITVTQC
jgi:hypothetical protein